MDIAGSVNGVLKKVPAWPLYIVGAAYAGWQFYLAATGQIGVDPINLLEREYGAMALKLIIAGLLITPLRKYTGLNLLKFRRAIGVTAFFLVLAHFMVWAVLDVGTFARVWADIVKRPYVTIGMGALVLMLPLVLTSNNWSLRKLGGAAWRKLHKLTYPAAILAGVHYVWLVKGWQTEPLVYLTIILGLLATRIRFPARSVTA
jgi:methionine sulfoxide reductase heme-binding subunit